MNALHYFILRKRIGSFEKEWTIVYISHTSDLNNYIHQCIFHNAKPVQILLNMSSDTTFMFNSHDWGKGGWK